MATNIDDVPYADASDTLESILRKAVADGVENEKCIVSQYRTTKEQVNELKNHLSSCSSDRVPIEWVIDIADESNGWFYGTAYHFNDETQMVHIMVPDKTNPTFDGDIHVDYRTMHLVECVDGKTDALFNKFVRDSVVKVRWEVDWFEEGNGTERQIESQDDGLQGRWVQSIARYYIQYANQLLVEDEDFGQDSRGFVMFTADLNLRLRKCIKGKGLDDFIRLISENVVQSSPNAIEDATLDASEDSRPISKIQREVSSISNIAVGSSALSSNAAAANVTSTVSNNNSTAPATGGAVNVKKLAELSSNLKDCLSDVLDDRERLITDNEKASKAFLLFALNGDLDAGLKLFGHAEDTCNLIAATKKKKASKSNSKGEDDDDKVTRQEQMDAVAEDAWYLSQKVEKYSHRLLKSGNASLENGTANAGENASSSEVEHLRKLRVKLQQELEERDRELEYLRAQVGR